MNRVIFENIFETAFDFLKNEFGFQILTSCKEDWGYHLIAKNSTTGVEVIYEFREALVQVIIYKLANGKIMKNMTRAIKSGEPISGFSLEWILALRNPEAQIKPAYKYGINSEFYEQNIGLKNYIDLVVSRLKEYASDNS